MFILFIYSSGGEVIGPFDTEKEAYDWGKVAYSTKVYHVYKMHSQYDPIVKIDSDGDEYTFRKATPEEEARKEPFCPKKRKQ